MRAHVFVCVHSLANAAVNVLPSLYFLSFLPAIRSVQLLVVGLEAGLNKVNIAVL